MATESTETWNRSIFFALRILMHIIAAVQIIYGLYYDFNFVYPPPDHSHYKPLQGFGKFGKFRFLTVLNAVCAFNYYLSRLDNFDELFAGIFFYRFFFSLTDLASNLLFIVHCKRFYWYK